MANIAPDGTASGSVTGDYDNIRGVPANTIDESTSTVYGFDTQTDGTTVVTLKIDLGSSITIGQVELEHSGAVGGFGSDPFSGDYTWAVTTSTDDSTYSAYMNGVYNLDDITDTFDAVESQETSRTVRYVKVVTSVDASVEFDFATLVYEIEQIYIYEDESFTDIGIRVGTTSIGAIEATGSEALNIYVNGTWYGIPFNPTGRVKIYNNGEWKGLQEV